jgi:hypothetical protein
LLGGIHLPDLVRLLGALRVVRGPSALGCRTEARLLEPPLQGAFDGEVQAGVVAAQQHADQPGSPAGMVTAETQGLRAELRGRSGVRSAAVVIRGKEGVGAVAAQAPEQVSDGALRKPQGARDGRSSLSALGAVPEGAAERDRNRRWHGRSSR